MTLEREEDGHTKALLNGIKEVIQYQQGLALGKGSSAIQY